ncbi:MAG: class I SAM-dependent methyltransferase [Bacteroidetes bacterium]|nr:class I SAM-dependent methyltransferase [Bacteroidota bacterium]
MNKDRFVQANATGLSTLENIKGADRLNAWIFRMVRPYMRGRILEVGSGIGNISSQFVRNGISLTLSDYSDEYCDYLQKSFSSELLINGVIKIDLADKDFGRKYAYLLGSFDTVFALNVMEHIGDDRLAIANCHKLLARGGRLVLLMPAYPLLYNGLDRQLGHYRRYDRRSMERLLSTKFSIVRIWYYNLGGILGWFIFGTIFREQRIREWEMNLYDRLVGLFRLADRAVFNRVGLSVVGVGKKE